MFWASFIIGLGFGLGVFLALVVFALIGELLKD